MNYRLACGCLAATWLLFGIGAVRGDEAVVDAYFLNHKPSGHDEHIQSASMDDGIIGIVVHGTQLPDGPHEYRMTITDGRNHDVFHYQSELKPYRGLWFESTWHVYNLSSDAPGTWSFTAEIDGKQVLERDIQVDPAAHR